MRSSHPEGGDQVDEQDDRVAHRHILATSPRITKLDTLTGSAISVIAFARELCYSLLKIQTVSNRGEILPAG